MFYSLLLCTLLCKFSKIPHNFNRNYFCIKRDVKGGFFLRFSARVIFSENINSLSEIFRAHELPGLEIRGKTKKNYIIFPISAIMDFLNNNLKLI